MVCCCYCCQVVYDFFDSMTCGMPGFPVLHSLPHFAQTHLHWVSDAISFSVTPFSSFPQSFPASGSFPMSWLFPLGGQIIGAGASASAPVLPMYIRVDFPESKSNGFFLSKCSSLQLNSLSNHFINFYNKHFIITTKLIKLLQ